MIIFDGEPLVWCDAMEHRWLPRWLYVESHPLVESKRKVQHYASVPECFKARGARTLCLHRTYAMGDILMLFPIARALRRLLGLTTPILIPASLPHYLQLRSMSDETVLMTQTRGIHDYGCDIHVQLDKALERDHYDPEYARQDRLALYARAMGCEL